MYSTMSQNNVITLKTKQGFEYSLPKGKIPLQEKSVQEEGVYEKEVESTIYSFVGPGMTVVECGSSCGYHTLNLASAVGENGKVYCFEANPEVIKYLEQNISSNGFANRVKIINKGVSSNSELTLLSLPESGIGIGGASLAKPPLAKAPKKYLKFYLVSIIKYTLKAVSSEKNLLIF